jgi:predicted enzyme related to lactoylglutathione lyase
MGNPVVHFEIIGRDPARLRTFFTKLFEWESDTNSPVAKEVSQTGNYGFINRYATPEGVGIPGGVGGGTTYEPHSIFYVGVPNVEDALKKAERLGGKRAMGPVKNPGAELVVAQFTDPEGNLIGLAGPT